MKRFISGATFASLVFIFWTNAMAATTQEIPPLSNYVLVWYGGAQDSALSPLLIAPKSAEQQENRFLRDGTTVNAYPAILQENWFKNPGLHGIPGIMEFRVDPKFFEKLTAFFLERKSKWNYCSPSVLNEGSPGYIEIRWDFATGNGGFCGNLNDTVAMFDELSKVSVSSNNDGLSVFVGEYYGRAKQNRDSRQIGHRFGGVENQSK